MIVNSSDVLIDRLVTVMRDCGILADDASCEDLEHFRELARVEIRMHKLRIPRFYSTRDSDDVN